MNIIFAANDYAENGGFHNYLFRVTKALNRMGHKVIIIKCGKESAHRYVNDIEIWETTVNYSNYRCQWFNTAINHIKASICINKKITEIVESQNIDIIQFTSLKSLSLLYFGKIPAVMRLSSYAKKAYPTYETLHRSTVNMMSILEVMAGKRCNAVFAPSDVTASAYEKDFHKKVYRIESPFMSDVSQTDDQIIEQKLRGKKYALFFGNLYFEKGILTIAGIIGEFLKNNSEYFFVFAGRVSVINGKSAVGILSEAAGKYRERVIFLGELSHEQLYPVIRNSDFVVLPSIMENLSNACIEAMYFSKIVIGTDGASFEQLIDHDISGLLCRIGDSKDLLDKMQEAVNLPKEVKKQMEYMAHKRIEKLRPEIVVNRLVRFYEKVIEKVESGKRK